MHLVQVFLSLLQLSPLGRQYEVTAVVLDLQLLLGKDLALQKITGFVVIVKSSFKVELGYKKKYIRLGDKAVLFKIVSVMTHKGSFSIFCPC